MSSTRISRATPGPPLTTMRSRDAPSATTLTSARCPASAARAARRTHRHDVTATRAAAVAETADTAAMTVAESHGGILPQRSAAAANQLSSRYVSMERCPAWSGRESDLCALL